MFKEFFTGGPEVKEAQRTIRALESKSSLSKQDKPQLAEARRISRRHALKLGRSGLAAAALGGTGLGWLMVRGGDPEVNRGTQQEVLEPTILPEVPFTSEEIQAQNPRELVVLGETESFDKEYLNQLFVDLKAPIEYSSFERLKLLKENLGLVVITQNGKVQGVGSALKICESGYYLSAAHLFMDENFSVIRAKASVYSAGESLISSIRSVIFDPETDLAIFFAPNGKERKKTDGIQFVKEELFDRQKLWLLGFTPQVEEGRIRGLGLGIPYGRVDLESKSNTTRGKRVFVKGMTPFGGASGGPVIDQRGNIVGVESGAFSPQGLNLREEYTHATVSPIVNLKSLNSAQVHYLKD